MKVMLMQSSSNDPTPAKWTMSLSRFILEILETIKSIPVVSSFGDNAFEKPKTLSISILWGRMASAMEMTLPWSPKVVEK